MKVTKQEVEQGVLRIVREHENDTSIELSTNLREEHMNIDSLDLVEFAMGVEDEYNVVIPDAKATGINTVQDLADITFELIAS